MKRQLQQVKVLLRNPGMRKEMVELKETLVSENIMVEENLDTVACEDAMIPEKCRGGEGVLWITDDAKFGQKLRQQGEAVLICLHEGNREEDSSGILYACEGLVGLNAEYLERVYRRYYNLPWDILDTRRCHLRETTEGDLEDFYRIYADPAITYYMENLYADRDEELQYIRDYREKVYGFCGFGIWTVELRDTGEVIGRAGLCYREGYEEPELGFVIGVRWQRQGIAAEICQAILEYGSSELGFDRIRALVETENQISLHLCARLGFERERQVRIDGKEYWELYYF